MPDDEDIPVSLLQVRLATAQALIDSGKPEEAERLYEQELKQLEATAGADSPLIALVLLDQFDLYEKQGKHEEGKVLWSRMRKIVLLHLVKSK